MGSPSVFPPARDDRSGNDEVGLVQQLLSACRPALLKRIGRRMSARLAQRIDAEDVLQDSLTIALRFLIEPGVRTADDLLRLGDAIAHRRLRHEARQQRVRETVPLEDEASAPKDPAQPRRARAQRPALLDLAHGVGTAGEDHQWALLLRSWLSAPWDSVALVLNRGTQVGAERLHDRARLAMRTQTHGEA